jgi:hypothetical protein
LRIRVSTGLAMAICPSRWYAESVGSGHHAISKSWL